jgi:5'-3' exoribonuclease 2
MGIPLYFKIISDKYSDIIIDTLDTTAITTDNTTANIDIINHLFLDLNCAIHPCCRNFLKTIDNYNYILKNEYEKKMINSVLNYIEKLVTFTNSNNVFISIDGVAPKAKMVQQRNRRFKSIKEKQEINKIKDELNMDIQNSWDTNSISPGTEFMKKLNNAIKLAIDTNPFYKNKKVIFSNSNVAGEGEHKILKYIKQTDIDGNIIIYGLDADLIMLALVSKKQNCFLLREAVEFGITDYDRLLYLSIDELKYYIIADLNEKFIDIDPLYSTNPKKKMFESHFIMDYIFICFLLGNDFIPHIPAISLRNGGIDKILKIYLNILNTFDKPIIENNKLNNEIFIQFIRKLSLIENELAIISHKKRIHSKPYFKAETEYDRRCEYLNNLPSLCQETKDTEKYINMGSKYWRDRYYNKTMGLKTPDEIKRLCQDYIKTLKWTFLYYFDECPSFYWSYNYSYGPSITDIYNYIKESAYFNFNSIKFSKKMPYSSLIQLLSILPPESKHLLPNELQYLFGDKSQLYMFYPNDYKLNMLYKKYYWMCEPNLPIINVEYIQMVLDNMKISSKSKKLYIRQKIYTKMPILNK